MNAMPKDAKLLIYISLPFIVGGGSLLLVSNYVGGWDSLDYFVYALFVGAAWAVAVAGYLAWIIYRDAWRTPAGTSACAVLGLVFTIGGVWGMISYRADNVCRAAIDYYQDLAAAEPGERAALIAAGGAYVSEPTVCARDGLLKYLGLYAAHAHRKPPPAEAERLAVIETLLAAGLPPADPVLVAFTRYGDLGAVRLLVARRRVLRAAGEDWPSFSIQAARVASSQVNCDDAGTDGNGKKISQDEAKYRGILAVLVEGGTPESRMLDPQLKRRMTCLGLI
jgi:hypothetical protein